MALEIATHPNKHTTAIADIEATLDGMKGPVDSFVPNDNKETLAVAVETGRIPTGVFFDCAIFDDSDDSGTQRQIRYDAKRAYEVLKILNESETLDEQTALDMEMAGLFVKQTLARAILVEATAKYRRDSQNGNLDETDKARYLKQIDEAQAELFPLPDVHIAEKALDTILMNAQSIDINHIEHLRAKYPFLHEPAALEGEALSAEKRQEWYQHLHEKYDPYFEEIRETIGDQLLEEETLVAATKQFMKLQGIPMQSEENNENGWTCVFDPETKGFRVDPNRLQVVCGRRDQPLNWLEFEKLMMHEIVIHVTRAENGRQTGYPALQNGLPGYYDPEEGTGLIMESLWSGESPDELSRSHFRYVAICYADGVLDGQKHSEDETLTFVVDLMNAQHEDDPTDSQVRESRKESAAHVLRTFRGMPPEKRMYSNLSYLMGKMKMSEFIGATTMTAAETLAWLQRGKTNPLDMSHEDIMLRVQRAKEKAVEV